MGSSHSSSHFTGFRECFLRITDSERFLQMEKFFMVCCWTVYFYLRKMDNHDRRHSPYPFLLFFVFQIVIWFWTTKKRHTHHRYGNELTLYFESIFFCKRKTNERLLLCFMSHLSMIILSHRKTEKRFLWLVLGYFLVMDGQFLVRMNSINQF